MDTELNAKVDNLHNIKMNVTISKILTWRLKVFMILMRLACWVGSMSVEFEYYEPVKKER